MSTGFTLPPWSFTMLELFEQCPFKAFNKYVLKLKEPETEAMRKGNLVDKALEARVKDGVVLKGDLAPLESLIAPLAAMRNQNNQIYTQLKMGIKRDFTPADFWAKDVWGRGAIDFLAVSKRVESNPCTALVIDYKNGKNNESASWYDGGLQRKIFTLLTWKMFPGVDRVTTFNLYLTLPKPMGKPLVFTRADEANLWREVLPKIMRVEKAFTEQRWPVTPGPLCGYCPVKTCQFNRS